MSSVPVPAEVPTTSQHELTHMSTTKLSDDSNPQALSHYRRRQVEEGQAVLLSSTRMADL